MHQSNVPNNDDQGRLSDELLGKTNASDSEPKEEFDQLEQLLCASMNAHLPESSTTLRAKLEHELAAPSDKAVAPSLAIKGETTRGWHLVAGAILATAGTLFLVAMISMNHLQHQQRIARLAYHKVKAVEASPMEKQRFRYEKRTREVPVTNMKTQTKTRMVPVANTRIETRTRTVIQDGEETQQAYQVSVPYTENVSQSYTVQVPVTSTKTESYTVQIPVDEYGNDVGAPTEVSVARSGSGAQPQGQRTVDFDDLKQWGKGRQNSAPGVERRYEKLNGAWSTQINRAWLETLPAPQLPADSRAGTSLAKYDNSQMMGGWYYRVDIPNRANWRINSEQYESPPENDFVTTEGESALSTFSIDVDTASYSNARRFLSSGKLPPPQSVRIEEFLNYFSYDYPQPKDDKPFSVSMEVADCPWTKGNKLIRIGLQGKKIKPAKRPPSNLVFLLDVSGSMRNANKLPLLKRALKMMVSRLREDDYVSIVTYAGHAGVALEPTCGDQSQKIIEVIDSLTSGGSTNGSAGIDRAYELATENFLKDGTNRVILATDGDLNVGITDDQALVDLISSKAGEGVFLTVLGFGTGNLKDAKMEKLANNGNGVYAYIDGVREARKVLLEQISANLITIAKDVKLQLEFNPRRIASYRLIGYENRKLVSEDFDNDAKDAGEIGAGHSVTALYEIVPVGSAELQAKPKRKQAKLKYQDAIAESKPEPLTKPSNAANSDELLTLALRYKQPDEDSSQRIEFVCKDAKTKFKNAGEDFRFSSSVAAFGMLLRNSNHVGEANVDWCEEIAADSLGEDEGGYRSEFVDLIRKARNLIKQRGIAKLDNPPPAPVAVDSNLAPLIIQRLRLLEQYGERHPKVKSLDEQIKQVQKQLKENK